MATGEHGQGKSARGLDGLFCRGAVSGLADIGRTHLSAIERGARKPTLETFFRLAEAMGIGPSELMKRIERELQE